jgi:hypothetical protein
MEMVQVLVEEQIHARLEVPAVGGVDVGAADGELARGKELLVGQVAEPARGRGAVDQGGTAGLFSAPKAAARCQWRTSLRLVRDQRSSRDEGWRQPVARGRLSTSSSSPRPLPISPAGTAIWLPPTSTATRCHFTPFPLSVVKTHQSRCRRCRRAVHLPRRPMASERRRRPVRRRRRLLLQRRASELSAKPRSAEQPTKGRRSTRSALQHGCWETTAGPCGGTASTAAAAYAQHASGRFPQLLQREQPTPLQLPVAPFFVVRLLQLFLPRRRRTGNTRRPGFSLRSRQDGGARLVRARGRVPLFPYDQLGDWDAPRQRASFPLRSHAASSRAELASARRAAGTSNCGWRHSACPVLPPPRKRRTSGLRSAQRALSRLADRTSVESHTLFADEGCSSGTRCG